MTLTLLIKKLWCFAAGTVLATAFISTNTWPHIHISTLAPKIELGKESWTLEIKGLYLRNFPGLPKSSKAEIPSLFFEVDPARLMKGQLHFKRLNVHVATLTVTQTNGGQPSVDSPKLPAFIKILIDRLELKIDRIVVEDKVGTEYASTQSIRINFEETYKNLEDYAAIVSDVESKVKHLAMSRAMKDLDPLGVVEVIEGTYRSSRWAASEMSQLLFGF